MNETTKPRFARQFDTDRYNEAVQKLLQICEENVQHAFDRDDQMDIIIAQKQLIGVMKLKA